MSYRTNPSAKEKSKLADVCVIKLKVTANGAREKRKQKKEKA